MGRVIVVASTQEDLQGMRAPGKRVRRAFELMKATTKPDVSTREFDAIAIREFARVGAGDADRLGSGNVENLGSHGVGPGELVAQFEQAVVVSGPQAEGVTA